MELALILDRAAVSPFMLDRSCSTIFSHCLEPYVFRIEGLFMAAFIIFALKGPV